MNTSMTRYHATWVLLVSLLLIVSGCVDRNQWKADVLEAVRKHESVRNYRFSGYLEHETTSSGAAESASSRLWSIVPREGAFSWQGVASFEPLRAEAEIGIAAAGRDPVTISLFIQHNKMVFQLPAAQAAGQYFSVDLGELADGRNGSAPLGEAGNRFAGALAGVVEAMDAKWFDEPEELASGKRITVSFNQDQAEPFAQFWQSAWPAVAAALSGYLPEGSLPEGGAASAPAFTLHEPARFTFVLDDAGYLAEFGAEAHMGWQREDGTAASRKIRLVSRLDDINADPPFERAMPEEAVPFERLLDLLRAASEGDGTTERSP
jgi:hypothetical protein